METLILEDEGGKGGRGGRGGKGGDAPLALVARGDGRIAATLEGRTHLVSVRQCFPWSAPGRFLSLRDADDVELAMVGEPDELVGESRAALEGALREAGFVLEVVRVLAIDEEVEVRAWHVDTAHGERRFQTRLDDWPRRLPGGALLVRDVAGDLYHLADPGTMDKGSRALLWAFVDGKAAER